MVARSSEVVARWRWVAAISHLVALGGTLLFGCGFRVAGSSDGGPPHDAAADDGDIDDAMVDASSTTDCLPRWRDHTIRFATATPLAVNDAQALDRDPFLSPDERTLYFSSGTTSANGGADIFISTRSAIIDPWGDAVKYEPFSSGGYDGKVSMSGNALHAVVSNSSAGNADIYELVRATTSDPWGPPSTSTTMAVNTNGASHSDPFLTSDGLRLYFAPAATTQLIAYAKRVTIADPFGPPIEITELTSNKNDGDPTLADDDKLILFYSNRDVAANKSEIYYATRATADGTFVDVRAVPDINTVDDEGDPHLSADGCRIYFARRPTSAEYDLYSATAQP